MDFENTSAYETIHIFMYISFNLNSRLGKLCIVDLAVAPQTQTDSDTAFDCIYNNKFNYQLT